MSNSKQNFNPMPGETWATRSGDRVTVFDIRPNLGEHPLVGLTLKKALVHYTRNGNFIGDSFPHKLDLIEKI